MTADRITPFSDIHGEQIYEGMVVYVKGSDKRYNQEKGVITFYIDNWYIDMSSFYPRAREGWLERFTLEDAEKYFEIYNKGNT